MATIKVFLHGKEVTSLRLEPGQEYLFGRGDSCSVRLEDQPGISRQHFKVSDQNGTWVASVISKFGEIISGGQPVPEVELSQGSVFKLSGYDFRFLEADERSQVVESGGQMAAGAENQGMPTEAHGMNDQVARPPATLSMVPLGPNGTAGTAATSPMPQGFAPAQFEGNEEATNVGAVMPGRPFLRIVKSDGSENRVELDGKKWLAGREDTCDIFLPDRKASRRQFEITSTPEGYFITDMGSANGTVLNGDPLIPEDPRALQSGDVISVNSLLFHFEIRDPNFEKRLVAIPKEVLASPSMVPVPRFEIINYPVPTAGGGAVRVDGGYGEAQEEKKKPNQLRLILIGVIALGGLYAAFGQQSDEGPKNPNINEKQDALSRLTPQQKQLVKEIYVTARNLYMQGKFENAHEQLKKLHEILPEGYEGSKAMEEDCLAQRAAAEQLAFVEQERKRVDEQKRMIDRNIRDCNALASTSMSVDQIRQCLAPTIGLDPTNPFVADLVGRVERRVLDRNQKLETQRDYADRVGRGRALYEKAESLRSKSDWYAAIDAYNRHIASEMPDPNGLKAKSQTAIVQIKNMIAARIDEYLLSANSAYQAKNYRDAIEAAKKAKEFDPKSEKAAEFIGRVRRELNSQLRTIYEDAILYEGVGRVQEAQTKWKQIMDRDTTDGEYYQKSRLKLKNYSDQVQ
jgi:pSer/pThr/pTyr-binding forkhead associated (FHA) protein/tetratricopeptide (TPR) repeat protein